MRWRERSRSGRHRLRTWLRKRQPGWIYDRWPIQKARENCGNHEFYNSNDEIERCYHCEPGMRLREGALEAQDARVIFEARAMLAAGRTEQDVIQFFKDSDLSWIRSIRALALATEKGLGYAKPVVRQSDTWANERPGIEQFHEDLIAAVEQLPRDESTT